MIGNIHFLFPSDDSPTQTRQGKPVSQHIVKTETRKYVFGWDQPLMSFYLQVHDLTREDEDDQIIVWLGSDANSVMYETDDLVAAAARQGLIISHGTQVQLYGEKDDGV